MSVLLSCSKSVVIQPDTLSFGGVTLYPNRTYDIVYSQYDVGGVVLNFGNYEYRGDTLVLESNNDDYLSKLTEPVSVECEEKGIKLILKEYLSPYVETGVADIFWFSLSVRGISNDGDTIAVWKANSVGAKTDYSRIQLSEQELRGVESLWVEIFDTPSTNPIELPEGYKCLDITIPMIDGARTQVSSKKIRKGMDKFIIREAKRYYEVDAFQRQSKYRIDKVSQ